ncbi:MAG: class I SAM-dependent methyltransferase [Planctomycetota bacterium]|nr:class I SAM-dependent methyltransferase [Planctomycetota bacterium]
MPHQEIEKFEVYERAEIYQFAFSRPLHVEAEFFEQLRKRYSLPRECRVIDMGCGCGDWLLEIAKVGHLGTGIDSCEAMVSLARQRCSGYPINLLTGSLLNNDANVSYDAAFCLCGTIHHLHANLELEKHFLGVFTALAPKGLYVIDLHISEPGIASDLEQHWVVEGESGKLEVFFEYVPLKFDFANHREWVRLEVCGVFHGESVFLQNSHWFGAFTAERVLNASKQAGLVHLGWFSETPSLSDPLPEPLDYPMVYSVFSRPS